MKVYSKLALLTAVLAANSAISQNSSSYGEIHGNVQIDAQYYQADSSIGAPPVPEKMLSNGFANILYNKGNFNAGFRYEHYLNVMQGIDSRYKGTGIPYRFASYSTDQLEITIGNYYEQFGSGLALRIYEERGLGIDNTLDGVRAKYSPYKGIYLKGLIGKQRFFFQQGPGIVRGFDGEVNLNETFIKLSDSKFRLILGGSFVSKFQSDQNPNLILPENVGLSAGRFNVAYGDFSLYGEYAYKINDPNYDNGYIYKYGDAILLQATYSKKGMGISLGAKRIDNIFMKSNRDQEGNFLTVNFNPTLNKQHTYGLMAFYPYASQNNGEICFQGEFMYKFKKESALGGKYGTDISVNYSNSFSLDTTRINDTLHLIGYESNYFGIGNQVYFQDFNFEIQKKFSKKWKATFIYSYQVYNIDVIQGKPGYNNISSHINVLDVSYIYKDERALRTELQHLFTDQDMKNWAQGLVEWTLGEHLFMAVMDQWNYGNYDKEKRYHYFNASVGYIKNTNRFTLGYGKQRAGIFCVGGVCRYVPASNGITFSLLSSF